jgi:hypothetical protein
MRSFIETFSKPRKIEWHPHHANEFFSGAVKCASLCAHLSRWGMTGSWVRREKSACTMVRILLPLSRSGRSDRSLEPLRDPLFLDVGRFVAARPQFLPGALTYSGTSSSCHSLSPKLQNSPGLDPPFPTIQSSMLEQRDTASRAASPWRSRCQRVTPRVDISRWTPTASTSRAARSWRAPTAAGATDASATTLRPSELAISRGCPQDVRRRVGADIRKPLREAHQREPGARGRVPAVSSEHRADSVPDAGHKRAGLRSFRKRLTG